MIHHSNVTCDECGERHSPEHPIECRDVLQAQRDDARDELAECREERQEAMARYDHAVKIAERLQPERDRLTGVLRKLRQYKICVCDEMMSDEKCDFCIIEAALAPEEKGPEENNGKT